MDLKKKKKTQLILIKKKLFYEIENLLRQS